MGKGMKLFFQQSASRFLGIVVVLFCTSPLVEAEDDIFSLFEPLHESLHQSNYVSEPNPIFRIRPVDIVQTSVRYIRHSSKSYSVKWQYTEDGAQKMLAFREIHKEQKIRTVIGEFVSRPTQLNFSAMIYPLSKEDWLRQRTDKFFSVSEEDAQKIVAGLHGKTLELVQQGWNQSNNAIPRLSNFNESESMRRYQERWEDHIQNPNFQLQPSLYPSQIEKIGIR
jgi:hypothetical protein